MFIDTNVLVYATRRTAPQFPASRAAILECRRTTRRLTISRQILREYLAVVTRPQLGMLPSTMPKAIARVELFEYSFEVLEDGPAVTAALLDLCRTAPFAGRQVHDANIAATMLAHGESELLTFNVGDFARFAPAITTIVP